MGKSKKQRKKKKETKKQRKKEKALSFDRDPTALKPVCTKLRC